MVEGKKSPSVNLFNEAHKSTCSMTIEYTKTTPIDGEDANNMWVRRTADGKEKKKPSIVIVMERGMKRKELNTILALSQ